MKSRSSSILIACFAFFLGSSLGVCAPGQLKVTVLDFKTHGLAVVLETPGGKTWLLDTALGPKDSYYAARDVIDPFLKRSGIKILDGVVISHPHADHYGGLPFLFENYQIALLVDGGYDEISGGEMAVYRKLRAQYVERGGKSVVVGIGSRLSLDPELDVEILWPPKGLFRPENKADDHDLYNCNSVVLRVRHGDNVLLFPGDNHALANTAKAVGAEKLKCDLLVAPHHGIESSPQVALLTSPKFVLVSSIEQYRPSLVRPYELTKGAFAGVGSTIFATWAHGDITVVSDGKTLKVSTARKP